MKKTANKETPYGGISLNPKPIAQRMQTPSRARIFNKV
jgi:hypothetical protein